MLMATLDNIFPEMKNGYLPTAGEMKWPVLEPNNGGQRHGR